MDSEVINSQLGKGVTIMMDKLNEIWKNNTGADLTQEEAWKMVELVKAILENADRNLDNLGGNEK